MTVTTSKDAAAAEPERAMTAGPAGQGSAQLRGGPRPARRPSTLHVLGQGRGEA